MTKTKKYPRGFTLIEMLVVVLIIGILAGIALPQYRMAVMKTKVTTLFPLMRRFKDAAYEYYLQHGDYGFEDAAELGVNWPSDWLDEDDTPCSDSLACHNDDFRCTIDIGGRVGCQIKKVGEGEGRIIMYQFDHDTYPDGFICENRKTKDEETNKLCKALGGKEAGKDKYSLK